MTESVEERLKLIERRQQALKVAVERLMNDISGDYAEWERNRAHFREAWKEYLDDD